MNLIGKLAAIILLAGAVNAQIGRSAVDPQSAIVQDFEKRVAAYLKLRKSIESDMGRLKPTKSSEKISRHEDELRHAVRDARKDARPGDIFSPEISVEIRRLIGMAMQPDGHQIRQSLRSAEPVQLHLKINERYPESVPLQTTPPSLLENLPPLPPEIEYRITGRDLVLFDAKANLIVDIIGGVFS
jgi:hypothetical protein